jgi:hypothetical protein
MDVWTGRVMFEKRWAAVPPQLFTSNGTPGGVITVMDSSLFKVKQLVNITANTLPNLNLEVKSVPNDVTIVVGPIGANIFTYADISAYTTALSGAVSANEQKRSSVPVEEINRAVYEEEPTVALRNVLVDKHGRKIDSSNPLPTTATISGDVTVGVDLDAFTKVPADNAISVGTEDGTKTGVKHAARIDAELDLRVGISDGANKASVDGAGQLSVKDVDAQILLTSINNILSSGILKVDDDQTQTILNSIQTLLSTGTIKVDDDQSQTLLTSINAILSSGVLKVDDDQTQTLLGNILTQLAAGGLVIGTENGTPSGVQHVFVNNLRKMITSAHDVVPTYTYADFGTKNQRITRIDYVSATFPSVTIRRDFNYVLDSGRYRRINGPWSVV